MNIIDIHCHVYPQAIAGKAAQNVRNFYQIGRDMDGTPEMLLNRGEKAGIRRYVVLPVAIRPDKVDSINQFILDQVAKEPRFVGFGTLHAGMDAIGDAADQLMKLGFRGLKFHPDCQKFAIDDPRLFPAYEAIQGKLPVMLHMGDRRYNFSHPARLRKIKQLFPQLQVIAAHFGGYSMYETACHMLRDTDCIMDVSSSLMFMNPGQAEYYINLYGAERMAFGTDYPVWDPVEETERFLALKLTPEQQEQIAWKTATQFLGL